MRPAQTIKVQPQIQVICQTGGMRDEQQDGTGGQARQARQARHIKTDGQIDGLVGRQKGQLENFGHISQKQTHIINSGLEHYILRTIPVYSKGNSSL